jgi:hypothetical protein
MTRVRLRDAAEPAIAAAPDPTIESAMTTK